MVHFLFLIICENFCTSSELQEHECLVKTFPPTFQSVLLFFASPSQLMEAIAVSGHAAVGLSDTEHWPKGKYEPVTQV